MRPSNRMPDHAIAEMATREKGIVTRDALLAAGVSRDQIKTRLRRGTLIAEFPGVYRVGHCAPSVEARYLAAVKACGEGALLCGVAAEHLWALRRKGKAPAPEVLTLTERRVPGILTHRSRVPLADAAVRHGIPVTSVARTLVDIAGRRTVDELALACHEAGVKHGTTPRLVREALERRPRSPGAAKLRLVLDGDAPALLSKLERGFRRLLRENELPLPVMNRPAGGRHVDCRWPELKLTIELDSYSFHNSRHAWEQDRRREREARARGDDFRRLTYGDVFETPAATLRELAPLLRSP